jgi:arylsulfatase A-like enzyme
VETLCLDQLAREGVIFTQNFCTASQCSPSRASLLTGRMPHNHGLIGLTHRGFRLRPEVPTLPTLLAEAGYATHLFGFQHEAPDATSLGYQTVTRATNHSCLNVTPQVLDFLAGGGRDRRTPEGPVWSAEASASAHGGRDRRTPERPFFAMVGFAETHRPFPASDGPTDGIQVPPYLPDEPEVRRDVANLEVAVRRVDEAIGQILAALDEQGLAEETLFLYTTDHGIAFPGAKATLFDPGLGIAQIARGPGGFTGGRRIDAMTSNLDLLPTLLELCGREAPDGVQGRSLLPLVRGEVARVRDELFVELTYHAAYDPLRGVRTDRYKYIRSFEERPYSFPPNVDGGLTKDLLNSRGCFQRPRPAELLFDLTEDPWEQHNLAEDPAHAETLIHLRERVEQWMRETDDPLLHGPVPLPEGARVTPPDSYDP